MKATILFFVNLLVKLQILTPIRVARMKFFYKLHRWPNFEHPKDLNEKINWMKFYGDTSQWPMLADKFLVREYVTERGLGDHLIPLIGKWDSVDEVDWDILPNQFVMKCNNGSGDIIICKDKSKLDIEKTKIHFAKCLNEKLSTLSGEPHYAFIKPCIIAEELLNISKQSDKSSSLIDYKIWVFDGTPKYVWCTWNREKYHATVALYDLNWQFHPEYSVWTNHYVMPTELISRPKCLDQLLTVASILGKGHPEARVDLYVVNNKIYFGEMTMTSQGGYQDFFTKEFLDKLGDFVKLPIDKNAETS